jgi:putative CocE/NonD family hydrolase
MIVEDFPFTVERRDAVTILLADGTDILATLWLPEGSGPVPAIIEMVPYRRRDGTIFRDWAMQPYIAGHGFGYCRVDLRGSGDSGGILTDEYTEQEQTDAEQIIAWASAQPWCTGAVGMTGISWGGINALQLAARRPPALKAVITVCSTDDRYADDVHYMGGCLLTEDAMWSAFMLATNALPPDPKIVGERWRDMWQARLEANTCWSEPWLTHQRRDAYWQRGSVAEDYGAIEVPVYAVGGWLDSYSNAIPRLLANLAGPRKGLIGPWSHQFPCNGSPGPLIGYLQEAIRWWRHWLKGEDTGIMDEPMLRAWINDPHEPLPAIESSAGRWVAESRWPSSRFTPSVFYLNDRRLTETAQSGVTLRLASPVTAGRDCGRWGGYGGDSPDLATDQRREDGIGLTFDSEPLDRDIDLLGAPVLELSAMADCPAMNVTARLSDVAADGTATLITWGVLNLTHRRGHETPEPLVLGETFTATIRLNDIGRRIARGSRLRLSLATQHWPIVWPQPVRGELTVPAGASRLSLPIRPANAGDEALPAFAPVERAAPVPTVDERDVRYERTITEDVGTGEQRIALFTDYGRSRLIPYDIVTDSWCRETMTITRDDPLSARLDAEWSIGFVSDGVDALVRSRVTLTADAGLFDLTWSVEASDGGEKVHERTGHRRFARDFI